MIRNDNSSITEDLKQAVKPYKDTSPAMKKLYDSLEDTPFTLSVDALQEAKKILQPVK